MINSYVSIDLETTGLNPKLDKIIEIGAVKVIEGVRTETFSTYVNPGRKLEERITELTGIYQEQVDDAEDVTQILPGLLDFLEDLPLVGHRILFDYSFLKKAAVNQKLPFEKKGIDTLRIARCFLPQLEKRSLEYLCKYYEIPHLAHRALEDAEATAALYERLVRDFGEGAGVSEAAQRVVGRNEAAKLFEPQPLHYNVKKDSPITKAQKERLSRLIAQHNLEVDYDVEKLTRSEASRYTDKIYEKYGR